MERLLLAALLLTVACDENPGAGSKASEVDTGDALLIADVVPEKGDWQLNEVSSYAEDCGFMDVLGASMDNLMLGRGSFADDGFLRYRVVPLDDGVFEISNKDQESGTQCAVVGDTFSCDEIVETLYVSDYTTDFTMNIRWSGTFEGDDQIRGALEVDLDCGRACASYNRSGFAFPCTMTSELLLGGPDTF